MEVLVDRNGMAIVTAKDSTVSRTKNEWSAAVDKDSQDMNQQPAFDPQILAGRGQINAQDHNISLSRNSKYLLY